MNHLPLRSLSGLAQVRRPTQRALAKQRTREKILASAKSLFTEKGYEGATIRDIAAAAGMSTGAVFASFTDKSDLFNEIIGADRDNLFEVMRNEAVGANAEDALNAMFDAGYRFTLADLPLLQATMSVSWSPDLGAQVRGRLNRRPITELIGEVLTSSIERGELSRNTDVALISQMLWDSYLANFRHAAFEGWGLSELRARLADQVRIILAGAKAAG
ncbi:TetR/AcrR family transcriptional regulator [Caulobacter sp. KR2-114]|uniref:TetR/AcrR family transcriptional regulator n=1 Tax=Caulobacter sp. KR2-114 TaxID=3400912 RepID=UPI003C117408